MSRSTSCGAAVGPALSLCLLLFTGAVMWAQAGGTLTGTMRDQSGAPLSGARLVLTNNATQGQWSTVTTDSGSYTIPSLPPGIYTLATTAAGFKQSTQQSITIETATTRTLDVTLEIGATSQTIEVQADIKQVESDTSGLGTQVSPHLISDLPLQVSGQVRNPVQFIELTPGFTGNLPNTPTSQLSFKINGGQEGGTDVLLDGISISLTHPNLQMNYGVGTDAVAEFKVLTATFPAAYGRATGGIVDLVTKSGTNQLHGTGYGILRDKIFNANSWNNNYTGQPRGLDSQKDGGFEVAGPVWIPKLYDGRNKTFFMFNTEIYRYKTGGTGFTTVPDAAWNAGDFSDLLTPTTSLGITYPAHQLYDWTTCVPGPCRAFPLNQIPQSRFDPVVAKALSYFPKAQNSSIYNNFVQNTITSTRANLWTAKIDEYVTQSQKISGSYSYDNRPLISTSSLGAIFTTENPSQHTNYVRLNYAYSISPTVVNQFNAGFSRTNRAEVNMIPTLGKDLAATIGLKGVSSAQLPSFLASGVTTDPDSGDSYFIDNDYEYSENLSWIKGKHSLKFGIDARLLEFDTNQLAYSSGRFLFDARQTSDLIDPNSGFAYASLLLGAANGAWIPTPQDIGMRTHYYGAYAQDDFKVTSRLTLNLGLRWDVATPVREAHNRQSWLDLSLPNPGAGGLSGAYVFAGSGAGRTGRESPQDIYWKALGPRVGLAYQLSPSTVIRSAYGIYYSPVIVNGFAQTDSTGFSNSCRLAAASSTTTPVIQPGQMTGYPCALPPFINPTVSNGATGGSPSAILSRTAEPGRIQNWTFDIQHQLSKDFMIDVGYVGAHGDHLQAELRAPNQLNPVYMSKGACLAVLVTEQTSDPNCTGQAPVPIPYANFVSDWGTQATVAQALRPYPQYTDFQLDNSSFGNAFGFYTYEAMQLKLQKRFSNGFTMLASYAWSKTLTNADGAYPPEGGWNNQDQANMLNNYNATAEKALSAQDVPQWFVLSYSYELPFGKGKPLLNRGGVVNAVVGGWKVAAIHTYESGYPISINCGGGYTTGLFNPSCRVNVVPGTSLSYHNTSTNYGQIYAFNPAVFTQPASYTFGNSGRVLNIRAQNNLNEDVSLEKNFAIIERLSATLRLETFDTLNRHRFTSIDNTVTDPKFGTWNGVGGNRTAQISLRVNF